MRFAKVDDEVAFKALDRIADAIDDDEIKNGRYAYRPYTTV